MGIEEHDYVINEHFVYIWILCTKKVENPSVINLKRFNHQKFQNTLHYNSLASEKIVQKSIICEKYYFWIKLN